MFRNSASIPAFPGCGERTRPYAACAAGNGATRGGLFARGRRRYTDFLALEVRDVSNSPLRLDPGRVRMVAGEILARRDQEADDFKARGSNRASRQEKSAGAGFAGTFLRTLFLRRAANTLV